MRLLRDLKVVKATNDAMLRRIDEMQAAGK